MDTFEESPQFDSWLKSLKDSKGCARILTRVIPAENGNFGDSKPVCESVPEMRVHYGPGYRIYYMRKGDTCVFPVGWRR